MVATLVEWLPVTSINGSQDRHTLRAKRHVQSCPRKAVGMAPTIDTTLRAIGSHFAGAIPSLVTRNGRGVIGYAESSWSRLSFWRCDA